MSNEGFAGSFQRRCQVRQVGRKPYQIVAPGASIVRDRFTELIPARPYCADDVTHGLMVRQRGVALTHKHIQLNGPNDIRWLTFDVDRCDARFAAEDANLPQPTVIVVNPSNGHAHLTYLLKRPVLTFPESRRPPIYFAAAVQR